MTNFIDFLLKLRSHKTSCLEASNPSILITNLQYVICFKSKNSMDLVLGTLYFRSEIIFILKSRGKQFFIV